MLLPEPLRRHPVLAGAFVGLLLGAAGGLLWPLPEVTAGSSTDMQLAVPARSALVRYAEADFAALRGGSLWSGSGAAQGGSPKIGTWKLLGVVMRPQAGALVQAENRQVRIGIGQPLPDGGVLIGVSADAVEFSVGQCNYRRSLYAAVDVPLPTQGCPDSPSDNDAATRAAGK